MYEEQITHLEKLLEGYKERYKRGERTLEAKIRHTAAKIQELKIKDEKEKKKFKSQPPRFSFATYRRGCCGGR